MAARVTKRVPLETFQGDSALNRLMANDIELRLPFGGNVGTEPQKPI